MGAATFVTVADGDTMDEAFDRAVDDAQYRYGHAGYTGTIAEKGSYKRIPLSEVPDGMDVKEYAWQLIENRDRRIDDKWGPAGAIERPGGDYVFFGWASS